VSITRRRGGWALSLLGTGIALFFGQIETALARSLEAIQTVGVLRLCAHPNSLPFARKAAHPPGFQIELGEAIARQLGVALTTEWIVVSSQILRTDCDIVLDAIADPEAQADTGLQISKPYYRSGVGLAVPHSSLITGFASLDDHTKVGVQVGSVAAMLLSQEHVPTSTFGFEEDMLEALAAREIDAAAVTPLSAGYFNLTHPSERFVILPPDEAKHDLVWNAAVGLRKPDAPLLDTVNAALDRLRADGTIETIYAKYGISLLPPR
jgi:polar amino acid transport system substrate-binding protein